MKPKTKGRGRKMEGKAILSLMVAAMFVVTAFALFTAADDDDEGYVLGDIPYTKIGTAADLAKIGNDAMFPLNGKYLLTANITLPDDFLPIGINSVDPFTGLFNGGGHTVTLPAYYAAISDSDAKEIDSIGLFSYIKGATIRDLGVSGSIGIDKLIEGAGTQSLTVLFVGGIVGYAEDSTIKRCYSEVDIDASCTSKDKTGVAASGPAVTGAAGIVCYAKNTSIYDCYATGNISSTTDGAGSFASDAIAATGGIAGRMDIGHDSLIKDCYFVGTTEAEANLHGTSWSDPTREGEECRAGIVAFVEEGSRPNSPVIQHCYYRDDGLDTSMYTGDVTDIHNDDSGMRSEGDMMEQVPADRTETTFMEWDFDDTWEFDGSNNTVYPTLTFSVSSEDDGDEDKLVAAVAITGVTSPVANAVPSAAVNGGTGFTAVLSWTPADDPYNYNTVYTATITLTAAAGHTFSGGYTNTSQIAGFTVNGIAPVFVSNSGEKLSFTVAFPATAEAPPAGGGDDGFPWIYVIAGLMAAIFIGALLYFFRRKE
ncbi:MAG: hypothetical protein LBV13_04310 [Methanomassiliicoccaceae archaeon]|jgi:hypothetical protein|nr:hypothetical protein [Methanomassiliicoccaceae archaeon]